MKVFNKNKLFIEKHKKDMKKTIKLSERDLHNIVNESVEQILSEGNFWSNMNSAVKGAVGGWVSNNNATSQNKQIRLPDQNTSNTINELYKTVGFLAREWGQKGNTSNQYGAYMNAISGYVKQLENYFAHMNYE